MFEYRFNLRILEEVQWNEKIKVIDKRILGVPGEVGRYMCWSVRA